MKKKIFNRLIIIVIIFIIMVIIFIIFISSNSKKLTQPELDKIYNQYGIHLDQITKYNDDTYGIVYTEKELCNENFFTLTERIKEYCSLHAKIYSMVIYNIKTKQFCNDSDNVLLNEELLYSNKGNCDDTNSYIYVANNSGAAEDIQLIKDNKKNIDSYQKN